MGKSITPSGVVPAAIVEEAWQQVGASFERFCLTAGIATLAGMMEADATRLCGVRYGRDGKDGHRWGRTKGKLGFHGGKIELERPRVRARSGGEIALPSWGSSNGRALARQVGPQPDADQRLDAQIRPRRASSGGRCSSPTGRRPVQIGGVTPVCGAVGAWLA